MSGAEDCRQRAKECVEMAQAAGEPQKVKLLALAEAWLALADEAYRQEASVDRGQPASPRRVA
jgi:hypothetical protein